MKRYNSKNIKKLKDGRRVYRSKIYPNIPLRDDDIYVMTETGDRLDTLSYQYYQTPALWWVIAAANNIHDGHIGLPDSIILRIPINYSKFLTELNN